MLGENWIDSQTVVRHREPKPALLRDEADNRSELFASEIPSAEDDFARFMLDRPRELFEWVQKSQKLIRSLDPSTRL